MHMHKYGHNTIYAFTYTGDGPYSKIYPMRECSDAGSAQRLLRPRHFSCALPHHVRVRNSDGGSIVQRPRPELLHSCAAAQRRRATCARPAAARATCSLCWHCCLWPGRQLPGGWSCPHMPSSCTSAAVPRASPHAVWHSRTGHHVPASSSQSGRAVPLICH